MTRQPLSCHLNPGGYDVIPNTAQLHELPEYWQHEIRKLRQESAKMRRERNDARDALAALAMKVASR